MEIPERYKRMTIRELESVGMMLSAQYADASRRKILDPSEANNKAARALDLECLYCKATLDAKRKAEQKLATAAIEEIPEELAAAIEAARKEVAS